jgi:ATP-dependent Clp protease ATP-binding subunit ClpA
MGARPMERVIQEHIKKPLAEMVLFGALAKGGIATVSVNLDGDGLTVCSESETIDEAVPA